MSSRSAPAGNTVVIGKYLFHLRPGQVELAAGEAGLDKLDFGTGQASLREEDEIFMTSTVRILSAAQ